MNISIPSEIAEKDFSPPPYLKNPHIQTILGHFFKSSNTNQSTLKKIRTPDEDFIYAELFGNYDQIDRNSTIILLLHGLEGCSRSSYILETANKLRESDFLPIAMNFRTSGGRINKRKRTYHAGETGDLNLIIQWIRSQFNPRNLGIIGFSMGGNILLKYLGENRFSVPENLRTAVAISVPYNLGKGVECLKKGFTKIYDLHFLTHLKTTLKRKHRMTDFDYNMIDLHRSSNLYDFDDSITAPLHDFDNAEKYYEQSSSISYLSEIKIPTFLIQSKDDPFMPFDSIPIEKISENSYLNLLLKEYGGHVGFIGEGIPFDWNFWLEETITDYLEKIF